MNKPGYLDDNATTPIDPEHYDAWYRTPRGRWIGDAEFSLINRLLCSEPGETLLDVGCGTGTFSRRFACTGLSVTGLDPDQSMLDFARTQGGRIGYLRGDARVLPFQDRSFDHCVAITSLCFVNDPMGALREMVRVTRRRVVLGLLNRHSRLYNQKQGSGSYRGARWDSVEEIQRWFVQIVPVPQVRIRTAVFFPGGNLPARLAEAGLPNRLLWGGFLAVGLRPDP